MTGEAMRTARTGKSAVATVLLLAVAAVGVARLQPRLAQAVHQVKQREDVYVLPPPQELRVLTLGYLSASADLLWAKLLVEYGIHWTEKRPFPDLNLYLDAILELEPGFRSLYRFVDTLLVFRPMHGTEADARAARAYLERGIQARPYDALVWRNYGQFIAFLAPTFLTSEDEIARWRHDGARALDRAVELGDNADDAISASSMLNGKFGEREAAIEILRKQFALTDDPAKREEIARRLERLEGSLDADVSTQTLLEIEKRWRSEFPFVARGAYLQLGPSTDPYACAGLRSVTPACAHDWDGAVVSLRR